MFGSAVIERRFDGNKSRQVLILATQTVEDPGADARAAEVEGARVHLENGAAVVDAVAHHGTDDAELIRQFAHPGEEVAHGNAALPVTLESPGGLHQAAFVGRVERQ